MPANKRHHFVPQFYLRNFASDVKRRQICVWRIAARQHIRKASVKDQCAKDYLYGKSGGLEAALSELESNASAVLRAMIESRVVPSPDGKDALTLFTFVALQASRTVAAGDRENARATRLVREIVKAVPPLAELAGEHADSMAFEFQDPVGLSLRNAVEYVPVLFDLRYKLIVNSTTTEFVTSDAPVVIHNQWCERAMAGGSTGFVCAGLQIVLPISPRHVVLFFDADVYEVGDPRSDVVEIFDEADVHALNTLQIAVARDAIYYASESMCFEVDALPTVSREEPMVVDVFSIHDARRLVHFQHRPLPLVFRTSIIQVRDEVRGIPFARRAPRYRADAIAAVERMRARDVEGLASGPARARTSKPASRERT